MAHVLVVDQLLVFRLASFLELVALCFGALLVSEFQVKPVYAQ